MNEKKDKKKKRGGSWCRWVGEMEGLDMNKNRTMVNKKWINGLVDKEL